MTDHHALTAYLRALGRQSGAAVVIAVRNSGDEPTVWVEDGEADADAVVRAIGGGAGIEPGEVEIGGWPSLVVPLGPHPVDGWLIAARAPGRSWSADDRAAITFGARLAPELIGLRSAAYLDDGAGRDPLTGLLSREAFLEVTAELRAGVEQANTATSYVVDLEGISAVNDVLGFSAGDTLIATSARRILDWAGPGAVVGRTGGVQFAVSRLGLPDGDAALLEGRRLEALLGVPVDVGGMAVGRSVTVGIAWGALPLVRADELVARAFEAQRFALQGGHGPVHLHDDSERSASRARSHLELELRDAVAADGLRMQYQPEFDLRDGRLLGVEALLRWQHPRRGLIGPDEFIDVAETSPVIVEIGGWVIDRALAQLRDWQLRFGRNDLVMRINVAAAQLVSPELVGQLDRALKTYGLRGEQVGIELTERAMPHELSLVAEVLGRLDAMGVTAAMDDFGTGENTLTHLLVLPIDTIKIDRTFVTGMMHNRRARDIVSALVRLAEVCGLGLVAEGVETAEEAEELLRLGCYRAQGHLLGRAATPAELDGVVAAGRSLNR
jgi:diguanylate cyclase (GGDEF)-like protein